jgi:hypothetical protein
MGIATASNLMLSFQRMIDRTLPRVLINENIGPNPSDLDRSFASGSPATDEQLMQALVDSLHRIGIRP